MANVTVDLDDVAGNIITTRELSAVTISTSPNPTTGQLWPRASR